jgi:lipopolysaccharide transport system ATP-binding protein
MSSESASIIRVAGLGKRYRLRHGGSPRYTALRDVLSGALKRKREEPSVEDFWALRDVSFEVRRGDVLGVVGRNGAGKSTLLKVLSHITEPTEGRIELDGRVASLLEVGTGFHPELTGRENVFLNGAILGMTRREILARFDEIVAFAEIEKFLDTPVKHYSSGMYVRLAFAVAAHLEPEILVVDEVLAVGDADFQKKCMGKMRDVSRGGRTVLFVSHNVPALSSLCNRAVVLDRGRLAYDGEIQEGIAFYSRLGATSRAGAAQKEPRVVSASVDGPAAVSGRLVVRVEFESPWPLSPPQLGIVVASSGGIPVFGINTTMDPTFAPSPSSSGVLEVTIDDAPLHTGLYRLSLWFGEKARNYVELPDALTFHFVAPTPVPAGVSIDVIGSTRVNGHFSLAPRHADATA